MNIHEDSCWGLIFSRPKIDPWIPDIPCKIAATSVARVGHRRLFFCDRCVRHQWHPVSFSEHTWEKYLSVSPQNSGNKWLSSNFGTQYFQAWQTGPTWWFFIVTGTRQHYKTNFLRLWCCVHRPGGQHGYCTSVEVVASLVLHLDLKHLLFLGLFNGELVRYPLQWVWNISFWPY